MGVPPAVLVLDDGELDDVQQLLQELAIPFARIRGGAIVQGSPPPRDLLVATPRRIGAVRETVGDALDPPIRVMVVDEDSNALRSQLRNCGFDYLVRRPVHAEALRLMLLHCVYKGEERRREPRVAVGLEVSFRSGLLTRRATLIDLSIRGCRLLSRHRVEIGKRIKVQIPEALDAGEPLLVLGRVVRVDGEKGDDARSFGLGVSFEKMDEDTRQALEMIIEDRAEGPATLRRSGADAVSLPGVEPPASTDIGGPRANGAGAGVEPESAPVSAREGAASQEVAPGGPTAAGADRRQHARAAYSQTVPAFGNRALRVLVGRDLSVRGMRIQPQPEVELGDRLHLAIYGQPGEEPMLVWGRVDRHDDDRGLVVRFDPQSAEIEARLEKLVAGLPAVESLHDSEAEAMGTVLSEIVG
jgi:hypothetical protein